MRKYLFICILLTVSVLSFAQKKSKKDYLVTLSTKYGKMHLILFDDTPLHKANFIKLVNQKFYDSLLFHRIIEGFMIQGGDPNSKTAKAGDKLGNGGGDLERIPYEFKPNHVHRKGALAAARDGNAEKKSSACQFYIVHGKKLTDDEITTVAQQNGMTYTTQQRAEYMILGGTPRLDNKYTVFGEVTHGMEIADKIASGKIYDSDQALSKIKFTLSLKK